VWLSLRLAFKVPPSGVQLSSIGENSCNNLILEDLQGGDFKFFLHCRLVDLPFGPERKLHRTLCLPTAYVADQLEHWSVLNLLQNGTYPDCNTLVKISDLSDPERAHPPRTMNATHQVGAASPNESPSFVWCCSAETERIR
jgi:hypothetical protein